MKNLVILFLISIVSQMQAQQAIVASGGNSNGSGGSASYSVGQIAYHAYSSSSGMVSEGVQQTYEITTLSTSETQNLVKNISLYPNPVQDVLYVDFHEESYKNSEFLLYDAQGKLIKQGQLNQKKNELNLSMLPQSMYILKVMQDGKNTKTFKIIKK